MFTRFHATVATVVAIAATTLTACSDATDPSVPTPPDVAVNYFVSGYDCAAQSSIPTIECQALLELFNTANGVDWADATNWLLDSDPCTWYGVECASGSVSALRLQDNQLSGWITPALGYLASLQTLVLENNQLNGLIPPELGNLSSLLRLDLRGNQLSGAIPPELGDLANLQTLTLDYNQLSGAIPPELGNLSSLTTLDLDNNQLDGSIPSELGNFSSLLWLDLEGNQLTGSIPAHLGDLAILQRLFLNDNRLGGSIPAELGSLSGLRVLRLDNNQLTGTIPAELGNLSTLDEVHLDTNTLTGQVPLPVAQLGGSVQASLGTSFCHFENNAGLFMPEDGAYQAADVDGDDVICFIPLGADTDGDGIPDATDPDILAGFLETIPDAAFTSGDGGTRRAMQSNLADIQQAILDGDIDQAIRKLQNVRRHLDGCGATADMNDWIIDCADQVIVRDWIDTLITNLGG